MLLLVIIRVIIIMCIYPRRQNVTTSMVGLEMVTYAKISPKMVKPRDIAGECRRRRRMYICLSDDR